MEVFMNASDQAKPLPARTLKFSRRMVALSVLLLIGGGALAMSAKPHALLLGVACAALGFAIFFTAGYYWACENESCS
jgi:hypothetical protein